MASWEYVNAAGATASGALVLSPSWRESSVHGWQWAFRISGTSVGASDEVAIDLAACGIPPAFCVTLLDAYADSGTVTPVIGTALSFSGFDLKFSTAAAAQHVINVQPVPILSLGSTRYLVIRPVTSVSAGVDMALSIGAGHLIRGA